MFRDLVIYLYTDASYVFIPLNMVYCMFIYFPDSLLCRVWTEPVKHKESAAQYSLRAMLHFKLTFTDGMLSTRAAAVIRRSIHTPTSHSDPIGPVETEGKKAATGSGK